MDESNTTQLQLRLLQQVRNGDRPALGQLLEELRPYVGVIVRGTRGSRTLSTENDSDLIQESLMQASRSIETFQGSTLEEWLAWLRTIAVRTSLRSVNSAREKLARRTIDIDRATVLIDQNKDPGRMAVSHETAARVAIALTRLPDDMRQVLIGRVVDDVDHARLAAELGRSPGAVRVLYLRALRRFREIWQTEFSSTTGAAQ